MTRPREGSSSRGEAAREAKNPRISMRCMLAQGERVTMFQSVGAEPRGAQAACLDGGALASERSCVRRSTLQRVQNDTEKVTSRSETPRSRHLYGA